MMKFSLRSANNLFLTKALLAALLLSMSASYSLAQEAELPATPESEAEKKSALTARYLIGDAVSLSNKKYPDVESAIKRFTNRDGKGAMEYLERAKNKNPKLPPASFMMAKMQLLTGNNQAVRLLLEKTVIDEPDDPDAYLVLADQAYRSGRTTESYALFTMVKPLIEKYSSNAKRKKNFEIRLLAGLSAVAGRRQQWDKSYDYLKKWTELDPESAAAQARLGLSLFHMDKATEARNAFTKARELDSKLPHPYISLAKLFSSEGDEEKARKSYERAYKEESSNEQTAQSYAEWLIIQGKLDQAEKVSAALRKQSPKSVAALLLDGIVAYMRSDTDSAVDTLQEVLVEDPGNARATDLLALIMIESDSVREQERALSYAKINADRYPNTALANITKAWVLYKLGRKQEAFQSLQKGSQAGQLQADSMFLIAKIMAGENQEQKAMEALEKGLAQKAGLFVFRNEAQTLLDELKSDAGN